MSESLRGREKGWVRKDEVLRRRSNYFRQARVSARYSRLSASRSSREGGDAVEFHDARVLLQIDPSSFPTADK